jgi:hypothetical protein
MNITYYVHKGKITGCQVPNQVEENYNIPKAQT